jgi:hypothetical protein
VLERKLGGALATATPSAAATLVGLDVVYSAHVSPHGAVPATLVPAPGTRVAVHLLALGPDALGPLDATEPNYVREALESLTVTLADGTGIAAPEAYLSRHGPLILDGTPIALAAVTARGRGLAAMSEAALLDALRIRLEPDADPDEFVLAQARDAAVRAARTRALRLLGAPVGGARARAPLDGKLRTAPGALDIPQARRLRSLRTDEPR